MAFGALCTLTCMISYLLLSNEHKETSDFLFSFKVVHIYSILTLVLDFSFPMTVRPTALLTLHLVFTPNKKIYIYFELRCLMNQVPYTKTQICIYLSFQSGGDFPAETKELGFPKLKVEVQFSKSTLFV